MSTKFTKQDVEIIKEFFPENGAHHCWTLINKNNISCEDVSKKASSLKIKCSDEARRNSMIASKRKYFPWDEDFAILSNLADPKVCYLLGLLWADGNVAKDRNRITLSTTGPDTEFLDNLFTNLGSWNKNLKNTAKKKDHWLDQYHYSINNPFYKEFLVSYGYLDKSQDSPEKIIEAIPENNKYLWMLGFFDGDGSITKDGSLVDLSGGHNLDWSYLVNFLSNKNIDSKTVKCFHKKGTGSILRIIKYVNTLKFCRFIYQHPEIKGFPRKYQRYLDLEKKLSSINIKKTALNTRGELISLIGDGIRPISV